MGRSSDSNDDRSRNAPLPFRQRPRRGDGTNQKQQHKPVKLPFPRLTKSPDEVLAAFDEVSRRMEDLARELKCLGYFNDEDDRPKAA